MAFSDLLANVDRVVLSSFGDPVTYFPADGDPVELTGVFDAEYVRPELGQPGVSTVSPAVFIRLSDLPGLDPVVDTQALVQINGLNYRIWEAKPDGQGGIYLILHRTT